MLASALRPSAYVGRSCTTLCLLDPTVRIPNPFHRPKPRVFLGTVAVAPRSDIKRHIEDWSLFGSHDLESSLGRTLREIFSLPSACEVTDPLPNDLGLDVVVPRFQSGEYVDVSLGDVGFPIIWRPKVTVASRLYYLRTDKTKKTFSVTVKMNWREYFSRVFSWRGVFRFRPLFGPSDLEHLTYRACVELVSRMSRVK